MSKEIESLRAEVAALRAEVAEQHGSAISRRRLLSGLAGLGAVGATAVAAAPRAGADDGDPLVLGQTNSAESPTDLRMSPSTSSHVLRVALEHPEAPVDGDHGLQPALFAESRATAALQATSIESYGVFAEGRVGVAAESAAHAAFSGLASGPAMGLHVFSSVVGAWIESGEHGVPLALSVRAGVGPPVTTEPVRAGSISLDGHKDLWLCLEGGEDPVWTRLLREDTATGRTVPVTPFRALDTRAGGGRPSGSPTVPGQKQGPLRGGQVLTLDLAGVNPIPATASGIVGNLTAVQPSYTGYIRVAPSGGAFIATALSFTKGDPVAGNAFVAKLGSAGVSFRGSGTSSNTYHLVVDITAYIT
jgi:hypothetical protein